MRNSLPFVHIFRAIAHANVLFFLCVLIRSVRVRECVCVCGVCLNSFRVADIIYDSHDEIPKIPCSRRRQRRCQLIYATALAL